MFSSFLWGSKSNVAGTPAPITPPESILSKVAKAGVPKLLQANTGKARSGGLRSLGKQILQMGKHWPKVDWRQFALMHSASIITETTFEGGFIGVNTKAWLTILNLWKKGRVNSFLSISLMNRSRP